MKRLIYLFISLLSLTAYGQVADVPIAVQLDYNNVIYAGVINPVTIAVEGSKPGSVSVVTDNGTVSGKYPRYELIPGKTGKAELTISWKDAKGRKEHFHKYFHVKEFPNPIPSFAGRQGGEIYGPLARAQIAPCATIYGGGDYGCGSCIIDSFTMIVVRNEKVAFIKALHNPHGARFSDDEAVTNFMKTLQNGDKLLFVNITCKGWDNKTKHLQAMEFSITDERDAGH